MLVNVNSKRSSSSSSRSKLTDKRADKDTKKEFAKRCTSSLNWIAISNDASAYRLGSRGTDRLDTSQNNEAANVVDQSAAK